MVYPSGPFQPWQIIVVVSLATDREIRKKIIILFFFDCYFKVCQLDRAAVKDNRRNVDGLPGSEAPSVWNTH